ncbi:MAG: DUF167 domain-containing protein [Patescibacteria group bacterium]|jgi:hypothetical protein|nr:DUF167 domain-containing protein [Patescibacteria group bacterium]
MSDIELNLKITPNAKHNEILGWQKNIFNSEENLLKIKIQAPPIDGKANQMLIQFLADKLKLKKSQIKILQGQTSQFKKIILQQVDQNILENLKK